MTAAYPTNREEVTTLAFAYVYSYLNAVRTQFSDQPNIYDDLVNMVQDFRRDTITTRELIQGAASLLWDKPALIQGFNIFLPDGYRMECGRNSQGTDLITVITPTRISTRSAASYAEGAGEPPGYPCSSTAYATTPDYQGMPPPPLPPKVLDKALMPHSMNFVSKIKLRFPDKFKDFLDALKQNSDTRTMLAAVEVIFEEDRALFEEFKAFVEMPML